MARSFSGVKITFGFVSDGFCNALIRRGYTAGAAAAEGVPARSDGVMKKEEEERSTDHQKVAWVPDPVTGYYRPENYADEMDAVDLRAKLLKPRKNKTG